MSLYETKIYGQFGNAVVYTDSLDSASRQQIQAMMDCALFEGSQVRIMPDVHAGKGSVIGFTAGITARVCSNIVGVDIGCGVTLDKIESRGMDFQALDKAIRANIPSGFSVRKDLYKLLKNGNSKLGALYAEIKEDLKEASSRIRIDHDRVVNSIGSLGGGNHFIELVSNESLMDTRLHIHSGSRGFGAKVAEYHQAKAYDLFDKGFFPKGTPKVLAWLEGEHLEDYNKDMVLAQKYASLNRKVMAHAISEAMRWDLSEHIESVHNFIDYGSGYIRKGAISAQEGEPLVIPISMAEGVIVGRGKGSPEWNYSAPHGAGRLLARGEAKRQLSMEEYKSRMEGIWTSCVSACTIDESPMAYKGRDYILERIDPTVEVDFVAKPVYNFKAGEEG